MVILSANRFGINWIVSILTTFHSLLTVGVIEDKITPTPEKSDYIFVDGNERLEVVTNVKVPELTMYITKEYGSTGKGKIYAFDQGSNSIRLVTFKIGKTTIKSLDKIIPTGRKMWCISKYHKYAFYVNENFVPEKGETIKPDDEFVAHPDNSDVIIKYTVDETGVSTGYAKTENGYKINGFRFIIMDFISETSRYVYLEPDYTFNDIDAKTGIIMSSKPRISDYRKVEDKILLIQLLESENDFKLSIYDCQTKMARACVFPLLLKIKEVKLFDYDKDNYHVILVHEDLNTCLWTNTATPLHFGRTVCTNTQIKSDMESNFFLHKSIDSQIFLNFYTQSNQQKTLRSTNNGRTWNEITILNPNKFKYDEPVHFIFSHHDPRNVPETFTEVDIQYQVLKDGLQPFITYDKGNSWTAAPKTRSNIILLNYGMVLLSIDKDTDYINYSFDYAHTWIRHKVFNLKPKVLYVGRLTETDQKALIIIKMSLTNLIKFTIIDFSKYFELDCTYEQYQLWDLPTSDGFCHHGTIVEMTTRIPDNFCVDKKDMHVSFKSICSCSPDYFGCTYGYQPYSDLCVPDSLFGTLQQNFQCKYESYHNIEDQRGFVKIQKNICLPHIDYKNKNQISFEFCGNYDHTNFLLLYSYTHLYISRVLTYATDIMIKRPISMDIYLNPTMGLPFAFDFPGQIIYSYKDKRIIKYPFFGTSQQSIYYLNDDVMAMVYDSLTHVLVYLTRRNHLKILSIITNFQQIFYEEVVTFKYIPYQRYISFVTNTNYVCCSDLRERPICYRPHFNVLQAYVDRDQYTMYLLTSLHVLEILTFVNNITDIKILTKIHDVEDFTVFNNNLYYLTRGNLMHMKMGNIFERFLLDANHHFTHLVFHRVYLQSYLNLCKNMNCQFMCIPDSVSVIKCGCPGNLIQYNNECICPENNPHCLANLCAGFFCDNSICLPDNVKCNGANDCGDNSDEINCSHKCTENNHLCLGSCISKDIVCGDDHIMDTLKDKKFSLTHISLFFLFFLLIASLISYLIYKKIAKQRKLLKLRRMRIWITPEGSTDTNDTEQDRMNAMPCT